ncbi:hypothetical protein [Bradyrhizobium sp.]|uniref:hypothetical protein n=1 Tax=Bradyrhizobium sp. TaxID=376 RepID=UPI001D7AD869|nr:hypothetical protein [Bradyrhizobium sp.]MBI5321749.1 hypothetical protein [Bradyrhizobium sp.]
MFRGIFGVLALILTTGAAPAASNPADVPLDQRIANAQAKIAELSKLAVTGEAKAGTESKGEKLAQHWHNWPNWNNWHDHWNNWHNHHWGNHHH